METDELISVREYLTTSYDPDCDYVDGVVEERNVGEKDHSRLQADLVAYFYYRRPEPDEQIFRTPPFICIEILSPEDRLSRVRERLNDYLRCGVPYAFLLDPETRKAYRWTTAGMTEVSELRTENPETVVPLEALFE